VYSFYGNYQWFFYLRLCICSSGLWAWALGFPVFKFWGSSESFGKDNYGRDLHFAKSQPRAVWPIRLFGGSAFIGDRVYGGAYGLKAAGQVTGQTVGKATVAQRVWKERPFLEYLDSASVLFGFSFQLLDSDN